MNKDVWILLCGYPFDMRDIQELNNAVSKFRNFLSSDRTRANLLVKVRVEHLSDIPASLVFGEG